MDIFVFAQKNATVALVDKTKIITMFVILLSNLSDSILYTLGSVLCGRVSIIMLQKMYAQQGFCAYILGLMAKMFAFPSL